MKVKVLREFRDKEAELALRSVDEQMEVSKERAEQLKLLKFVEEIPNKKETKQAAVD